MQLFNGILGLKAISSFFILLLITLDETTKEFVNFIIKDRNHKDITRYSFHAL